MEEKSVINLEELCGRLGGNKILVKKFLHQFVSEFQEVIASINALIDAHNNEDAKKMVHKLKGVSANLSLELLHSHCCRLEVLLRENSSYMERRKWAGHVTVAFEQVCEVVEHIDN